jgi:hypothetical protein
MNDRSAFDQVTIVLIQQRLERYSGQPALRLDHQRSSRCQLFLHRRYQFFIQAAPVPA